MGSQFLATHNREDMWLACFDLDGISPYECHHATGSAGWTSGNSSPQAAACLMTTLAAEYTARPVILPVKQGEIRNQRTEQWICDTAMA